MKWFWKVRFYTMAGPYFVGEITTNRCLDEINAIQDFYEQLMGARMTLEGMSETSYELPNISDSFYKMVRDSRG